MVYNLLKGTLLSLVMLYIYIIALPMRDSEYKNKVVPYDIMIMSISVVVLEALIFIVHADRGCFYDLSILNGTMIFMAYTDQRTKMVYTLPSLILIALGSVRTVCACCISPIEIVMMLAPLLLLLVFTLTKKLGFGDWLIYLGIAIMYTYIKSEPVLSFLICVFLSAILSLPYTVYGAIKHKNIKEHFPFTVYIALAVMIESVFSI